MNNCWHWGTHSNSSNSSIGLNVTGCPVASHNIRTYPERGDLGRYSACSSTAVLHRDLERSAVLQQELKQWGQKNKEHFQVNVYFYPKFICLYVKETRSSSPLHQHSEQKGSISWNNTSRCFKNTMESMGLKDKTMNSFCFQVSPRLKP